MKMKPRTTLQFFITLLLLSGAHFCRVLARSQQEILADI